MEEILDFLISSLAIILVILCGVVLYKVRESLEGSKPVKLKTDVFIIGTIEVKGFWTFAICTSLALGMIIGVYGYIIGNAFLQVLGEAMLVMFLGVLQFRL